MKFNPEKLVSVTIDVTERLVKVSSVNDSEDCPIARAFKKVVRGDVHVDANYDQIVLSYSGENLEVHSQFIETPARASKFMEMIDARDERDIPTEYDDEGDPLPKKLPPAPKPFSFKVKIKNKFLRPSLRA